jgi:hypothetical protein
VEAVARCSEEDLGLSTPTPHSPFPLGFCFCADIERRVRKLILFLAAFLAITLPGLATDISPNLAANHIGQVATVWGVVSQVYVTKQNNVFLNFGGVYPHHLFSAVVTKRRAPELLSDGAQWLKDLEGKEIGVTGEILIYAGKPEIVIRKRENLRISETKVQEAKNPEVKLPEAKK